MNSDINRIIINVLIIIVACFAFYAIVQAAPTLYSQAYPAGPGKPTSASVSINGTNSINCQLLADSLGAVTPTCDLASLPAGSYTLVLTVTNAYNCTTGTDGNSATCSGGGAASSDPFIYNLLDSSVVKPIRKFKP